MDVADAADFLTQKQGLRRCHLRCDGVVVVHIDLHNTQQLVLHSFFLNSINVVKIKREESNSIQIIKSNYHAQSIQLSIID